MTREEKSAYDRERYRTLVKPRLNELRSHRTETHKKWAKKNPRKARDGQLRAKYGISIEKYEEMSAAQEGRCAICQSIPTSALHVDHDHQTGQVRKLLCTHCNTMLGLAKESEETLQRAVEYLRASRLL